MDKIKLETTETVEATEAPKKFAQVGAWIDGVDTKTCGECGYVLHGWAVRQAFKFCPECGVPMMQK